MRAATYAAQLAQMDRCLRDYGPETAPIREQLRSYVAAVIASTWPDEKPRPTGVSYPDTSKMPLTGESSVLGGIINDIGLESARLQPADAQHPKNLMATCAEQYSRLDQGRWTVIEGARGSISTPFYWVLVFWLVILFACFGLTRAARRHGVIVIGSLRSLDHRRRLRDPRSGPALRRPVRHPEHVDARRARRHDALTRRETPSKDAALVALPVAVAQRALVELAGRQARQLGFEVDRARAFVVRQMIAAEADQLRLRLRARLEVRASAARPP